ncbi:hypothetical protein ABZS71_26530 [Streptomyces sp. NPDC005393]|uniref:hypothetical protein n=1 Tax=Streptomyces sp. NPDC005393 TaxID=3157041 RepID=UPI0033A3A328
MTGEEGTGHVSKLADEMEAVQLRMGVELLDHARVLLGDPKVDVEELRFLSNRLIEALRDALRVAESRGGPLPVPHADEDDGPVQANGACG